MGRRQMFKKQNEKNKKLVNSGSINFLLIEQYLRVRSTIFYHNSFFGSESIRLSYLCVLRLLYFNNL